MGSKEYHKKNLACIAILSIKNQENNKGRVEFYLLCTQITRSGAEEPLKVV